MKFLLVIFVLTVIEVRADYTYTINAHRTGQTIAPGYPVLYLYYQVYPTQNLTYFQDIGDNNPLFLEVMFMDPNGNIVYVSDAPNLLNSCNYPADGTLDYLAVKIIQMNLMPNGKCGFKKGNYDVKQTVDPITVTLSEMLSCGEYNLVSNVYGGNGKTWAAQVEYKFNINDDGNCAS